MIRLPAKRTFFSASVTPFSSNSRSRTAPSFPITFAVNLVAPSSTALRIPGRYRYSPGSITISYSGHVNGRIPQLTQLLRYLFVAYSMQMFARPPSTFWQLAAYSLAEPSPGLFA